MVLDWASSFLPAKSPIGALLFQSTELWVVALNFRVYHDFNVLIGCPREGFGAFQLSTFIYAVSDWQFFDFINLAIFSIKHHNLGSHLID